MAPSTFTPPPQPLADNFRDLHPPLTRDAAAEEAARCLFCHDAPCVRACPTSIDVPRFIRQILHRNPAGAAETILDANVLGGSCARACPTEVLCEGACVERALGLPAISIGRLQRFATDHARDNNLTFFEAGADTGRRVAVIGSGPAGLACAHGLRRLGHAVTMFEARATPGGLNTLGIAVYKLTAPESLQEIGQILDIGGIDLRLNAPVDAAQLEEMLAEYDAVFLGVGLGATAGLRLPGEDIPGVWEALAFIRQLHHLPYDRCEVGRRVVVLGCGNTAMDAATQAVLLGAEHVTIAYRRSEADMSAYTHEYELAKSDGVGFHWHVTPAEFVADPATARVSGVRFAAGPGGDGFTLNCDMVIMALGQSPLAELTAGLTDPAAPGQVAIDRATGATGMTGLFAGGDCSGGGREIVYAVADGKRAARGIDAYLSSTTAQSSTTPGTNAADRRNP